MCAFMAIELLCKSIGKRRRRRIVESTESLLFLVLCQNLFQTCRRSVLVLPSMSAAYSPTFWKAVLKEAAAVGAQSGATPWGFLLQPPV